ncbi:hypothetical protein ABCR94_00540 [Streptomyces sp. 21So2-11]|uniref:hypothetical protein n=1 Tax=Streptomyces sp. 21So2-11 TaxID=3144408 RepID=UPI003219F8EB
MAGWMRGMWRITMWHPDNDNESHVYLVPHWQARTEQAARTVAAARHADMASVMTDPTHLHEMIVGEVAFRPAVRSKERAVAWVALVQQDAITERGWPLAAERGGHLRDEVHKSALSYTWHTPYGVVWINQG